MPTVRSVRSGRGGGCEGPHLTLSRPPRTDAISRRIEAGTMPGTTGEEMAGGYRHRVVGHPPQHRRSRAPAVSAAASSCPLPAGMPPLQNRALCCRPEKSVLSRCYAVPFLSRFFLLFVIQKPEEVVGRRRVTRRRGGGGAACRKFLSVKCARGGEVNRCRTHTVALSNEAHSLCRKDVVILLVCQ